MATSVLPNLSPGRGLKKELPSDAGQHSSSQKNEEEVKTDRPMTVPENMKLRKKESDMYHRHICFGRHPRSFPLHGSVWDCVNDAKQRLFKVQKGQAMSRIVCPRYTPSRKKIVVEKGKARSKHEKEHDDKEKDSKHSSTHHEHGKSKKLSNETRRRVRGGIKAVFAAEMFSDMLATSMGISEEMRAMRRRAQVTFRLFGNKLTKLHETYNLVDTNSIAATSTSGSKAETADESLNRVFKDSDFNSLRGAKIFYGSMVALEFISQHMWLTIDHADAQIARMQRSSARGESKDKSNVLRKEVHHVYARKSNQGGQLVFRIIDLRNPQYNGPVMFGDHIWLSINEGSQEHKYRNGTVLGSRTKKALNLLELQDTRRTSEQMKERMGGCMPVNALCDTRREFPNVEMQNVNEQALAIGKWIVRKARVDGKRVQDEDPEATGEQLVNFSEVFLEQDWFHLSVRKMKTAEGDSSKAWPAVMCNLPRSDEERPEGSSYKIDSNGVWRLHLVETADDSRGKTTSRYGSGKFNAEAQHTEQLLYEARAQLRDSQIGREGGTLYEKGLTGGSAFTRQLRQKRQTHELEQEEKFLMGDEDNNLKMVSELERALNAPESPVPRTLSGLRDRLGTLPLKLGIISKTQHSPTMNTSRSDMSTHSHSSTRSRFSTSSMKSRYGSKKSRNKRAGRSRAQHRFSMKQVKPGRNPKDMTQFERNHYMLTLAAQDAIAKLKKDAEGNAYSNAIRLADEKKSLDAECLEKLESAFKDVEQKVIKDQAEFKMVKMEMQLRRRQERMQQAQHAQHPQHSRPKHRLLVDRADSRASIERDISTLLYRSELHPSGAGRHAPPVEAGEAF